MTATTAPDHPPAMTPEQLNHLRHQAERASTLEECAATVRQMPIQYQKLCQPLLMRKAVEEYGRMSLEELLQAPAVTEFRLDQDEIKQGIRQSYPPRLLQSFAQMQKGYAQISALEEPEAKQRYHAIFKGLEAVERLYPRLEEDFNCTLALGEGEITQNFGQAFSRFALGVNVNYLHACVHAFHDDWELATDKFNEEYQQARTTIDQYKLKAALAAEEQDSLEQSLAGLTDNYRQAMEAMRPAIEQEQDFWYKLCIITKAHWGGLQDGKEQEAFAMVWGTFRHISLKYSRLLEEDEQTLKQTEQEIHNKALWLRAVNLPEID